MPPVPPPSQTPPPPPHIAAMPPEGRHPKGSAGPTIGVIIIVILLVFGALYFWGAKLNQEDTQPLPLIPGDSASTY